MAQANDPSGDGSGDHTDSSELVAGLVRVGADPGGDGVVLVHLEDGAHRNVLSYAMSEAIAEGVAAALARGARALVLSAAPPDFCSGGSLEGLLERTRPLADTYRGYEALAACPVPTVAVVSGRAVGAGVNLALACDVVIAGESARFDPRFLDVGIHPGGGHFRRLMDRVGHQGAAALSLFGDTLSGPEAAAIGLAWRCVADVDALEVGLALARRAALRDPALVRRAKETLAASRWVSSDGEAAAMELAAQEWSVGRPEFAETVRRIRASLEYRRASVKQ